MIRPIVKNEIFLRMKSMPATPADIGVAQDLLDTLKAHSHECVGLAANMIGVNKCVIAFDNEGTPMAMFNPQIIEKQGEFMAKEGCLSLEGVRPTKRYKRITVSYQDIAFKECMDTFEGWSAQIIQHEVDHCNGIII